MASAKRNESSECCSLWCFNLFSTHVPITVVTVSHLPERLFFIIKYCLTRFVQRFSMCSDVRVGFVSSLSHSFIVQCSKFISLMIFFSV